jgi:hypothetical protein
VANASALGSPFRGWESAASRGLIVVVAAALAWYTWATWGDIQIDCGREIYVPLEILRGKLLYRDIWYPYGPLTPYVEATIVFLFGHSLNAFYSFGLAIAIGCALLLLEIGTMLEGRTVGLTAALALLFVGFGHSIFNYVFPYSYGATIGLLLGLVCGLFTVRYVLDRPGCNLFLAGLAGSLALLCKLEFGIACYLMLAFVLVMEAVLQRLMHPLLRGIAACAPGVVLWVGVYGWFFWTRTPAYMLNANWAGLPGTLGKAYTDHLYFLMGQRFIPREMAALAVFAGLSLVSWILLAKVHRTARNVSLAILIGIAVTCRFVQLEVLSALLVFPLGMFLIGCGFVAYGIYKLNQSADGRGLAGAAFGIFALLPAVRVFAGIKPYGYSIYYAMPLFLVFIIAISRCIKAATPALSADQQRGLINYLLVAEVVLLALICLPQANNHEIKLETSWGVIYVDPDEASVARQILVFISEQEQQGRRVAVLPEAPMFYALTGTEATSRWYTLLPGIVSTPQENNYISDLNRAAPEYILLTSRKTSEYGADYFGIDYNQKIYNWIESNYIIAGELGRFRRDGSGSVLQAPLAALIYQRRSKAEADR